MNIREDIQQLKTSERDLRKFGLLVGGVFAVLGLLFLIRHKAHYPYFLIPGVGLMVSGAIFPRALRTIYIAWMALAFTLGFVMSNVILTLLFFLLVTPIGLLSRLFGKDFLARKLDKHGASYWIPRAHETRTAESYERQF